MIHGPPTPAAGGGEPRSVVLVHVFFLEMEGVAVRLGNYLPGGGNIEGCFSRTKSMENRRDKDKNKY
jgi:hypothetical protein